MIARALLTLAILSSPALAEPVHAGHASAEWIAGATAYEPGKPVQTGIRLIVEDGWHTYWSNPGEAGSKFKAVWELPAGWSASEVTYPVPKRIPGELAGYGYEGEVVLLVTLTPPPKVNGPVDLNAKVSWLTCNDDSCVPGKAELKLTLGDGSAPAEGAADAISKSVALVPKFASGSKLIVRESGSLLSLSLTLPAGSKVDPAGSEVFPETAQAVDDEKPIRFEKSGPTWSASAKKSEYAEGPLKELKLVLGKKGAPAAEVYWKAP